MRTRLESRMGGKRFVSRMRIGTFHSICYDILKKAGLEFSLADELVMRDTAEEIIEQYQIKLSARPVFKADFCRKMRFEKWTGKKAKCGVKRRMRLIRTG